MPALVLKEATFNSKGTRVRWDGINRKPPMGPGFAILRKELLFTGEIAVTSVWASLYSREGELLGSGRGGLEVVQQMDYVRVDAQTRGAWHHYDWVDRPDLFRDPDKIDKAVALAQEPVLDAPLRP